jgi:hypothetical protein
LISLYNCHSFFFYPIYLSLFIQLFIFLSSLKNGMRIELIWFYHIISFNLRLIYDDIVYVDIMLLASKFNIFILQIKIILLNYAICIFKSSFFCSFFLICWGFSSSFLFWMNYAVLGQWLLSWRYFLRGSYTYLIIWLSHRGCMYKDE